MIFYVSSHRKITRSIDRGVLQYFLYFGQREVGLCDPVIREPKEYLMLGLSKGAELGASLNIPRLACSAKQLSPLTLHESHYVQVVMIYVFWFVFAKQALFASDNSLAFEREKVPFYDIMNRFLMHFYVPPSSIIKKS